MTTDNGQEGRLLVWETVLSGFRNLYWVELVHRSDLRLVVENSTGDQFEILVANPGPYEVIDEQFGGRYWANLEPGWTRMRANPVWEGVDKLLWETHYPDRTLFVVATWDSILAVVAAAEPTINQLPKNVNG